DLGRMSIARTATAATIRVACRRRAGGRGVGFACGPAAGWAPWCSPCHCQSAVRARCSWSRGSAVEVAVGVGGESGGAGERAEAVLDTVMADPADRGLACETHTAHGVDGQVDVGGAQLECPQLDGLEDVAELVQAEADRVDVRVVGGAEHGVGDEGLTGTGTARDSGCEVDGGAEEVVAASDDGSVVEPCTGFGE